MKMMIKAALARGWSFLQGKMGRITVVLSSGIVLAACAGSLIGLPGYRVWQEEVKLNDGRTIVVTQKKRCSSAYTGGNYAECIAREAWLTINLPEFSKREIVWHEHLRPAILNIHAGRLYVVGRPPTRLEFDLYGRPRPPYIGFVYESDNHQWRRIAFDEIPEAIYDTNMLIAAIPPTDTKIITLDLKASKEFNGHPGYSRHYKRVDPNFRSSF
jgi:hypothetical protein